MKKAAIKWKPAGRFQDILFHKAEGMAKITINRPEVRNAFRPQTVREMMKALENARDDEKIGVVILAGQGRPGLLRGRRPAHARRRRVQGREGRAAAQRARFAALQIRTCPSRSSPWSPATPSAAGTCCTWCAT
jgi:naphthoate synthase